MLRDESSVYPQKDRRCERLTPHW